MASSWSSQVTVDLVTVDLVTVDLGTSAIYSTLPIFFTAATNRALSVATNAANSGAS
jgi:hypothetical protein